MKNPILLATLILISLKTFSQIPPNDLCSNASELFVNPTCTAVSGTLFKSTAVNKSPCGNQFDVWYKFTVPALTTTLTVSVSIPATSTSLTPATTFMGMLNGNNCTSSTALGGCNNATSIRRYSNLIPGNTYLFRITTSATDVTIGTEESWKFNVCLSSNDACPNAVTLDAGVQLDGNITGASASTGLAAGCAPGNPDDDVWYKFTATRSFATITTSNYGTLLASSGASMQLFSGTCGSFTSLYCGSNRINASGLTPGDTYYVRVWSNGTGQTGTTWTFKILLTPQPTTKVVAGRMNEVYDQTILSPGSQLNNPWEVTYGPDNYLWVTEAKGYRVIRMHPVTGAKDTVLDINATSTFLPEADRWFNVIVASGGGAQGGCAGLALHPKFMDPVSPKNYVYLGYVSSKTNDSIYTNRVARFEYDPVTKRLGDPRNIVDTLPGSNDHNSQRMIIAPIGGVDYLFYASGDMGAGQFKNSQRPQNAQYPQSYEGKILRFNLEPDGDSDSLDKWIPSTGSGHTTNPYNIIVGKQSAVWAVGIRNNQGFAYDPVLDKLYGSSHGPFSDDEINVIERGRNYGHPLVIGYAADGNVNNTTAGAARYHAPPHPSSCPLILNESQNALDIGPSYKDPLFSAYANSPSYPTISTIWEANPVPDFGLWPSEGWSGLGLYDHKLIPGWHKSLIASSLKWGRLVRIRLNTAGTAPAINNLTDDTVSYFGSRNRFRDIAFGPGGKDIYVVMDNGGSSSGPSAGNPIIPACAGCLQKFSFLGYADNGGKSSIPTSIDVTTGTVNSCNPSTQITIDNSNNNYWVPITGPDGNILAEIYANGQNLGEITSSFYKHNGPVRTAGSVSYLDRNITITPQQQPGAAVKLRLYISKEEFDALDIDPLSGITTINDLKILKNADGCVSAISGAATLINPVYAEAHGLNAYMLQADISGFSSFYFGTSALLLPVNSVTLSGIFKNSAANLSWQAKNETTTASYSIERSTGNNVFEFIGTVNALHNGADKNNYRFNDADASRTGLSKLYYRLRITDKDGGITYSNTATVELPGNLVTSITVFPNPADKKTTILINASADQFIQWQLIDITGRKVLGNETTIRRGENRISIDIQQLKAGTYFLRVKGQFINAQEKIQKL